MDAEHLRRMNPTTMIRCHPHARRRSHSRQRGPKAAKTSSRSLSGKVVLSPFEADLAELHKNQKTFEGGRFRPRFDYGKGWK
jgi:hypothetical protein